MESKNEYQVTIVGEGRFDKLLTEAVNARFPELKLTRSGVQNIIASGVILNGSECRKHGLPLAGENKVTFKIATAPSELEPHEMDLEIVYEDEELCVINKPAGLVVHPGAGNSSGTLVNALVARFPAISAGERPGIVHRLDKDTTGLLVVAKNVPAQNALAAQFAARSVGREYIALVLTTPRARRTVDLKDSGVVESYLKRHPNNRKIFCAVQEAEGRARRAVTNWRIIERLSHGTIVGLRLDTGRTHQIRVHMDSIGSPVIGDQAYGDFSSLPKELAEAARDFGRQSLHAATLEFDHPVSGKRLKFEAPIPTEMMNLISIFRSYGAR